jgi:hypothetical protein
MKTRPHRKRSQSAPARRRFATRLSFESLEPRAMLSADPGWAFGLGGPVFISDVAKTEVAIGPDNHLYVAGAFRSTVDFDPGPGTAQLVSNINAQDGFIAKYTQQGGLVWVKQFGQAVAPVGVGNEFASAIEFDAAGHVYVSGWTNATAPQFGSTTLTGQGSWDAFVTKLDAASGTFLWTRGIGGVGDDRTHDLSVSASGDVYVAGSFRETVDFDPSPSATFNLTAGGGAGAADAYVWKLDSQGDFVWARQFSGPADEFGHGVKLGNDGYAYAVGTFRDTTDFGEPGNPLTLTSATPNVASIYFVKLDEATGDSIWAKQMTGTEKVVAARIVADGAGNLYVGGHFNGTMSFGAGDPSLVSAGGEDGFVSKWDTDGNFQWGQHLASGAGDLFPGELDLGADGSLLIGYGFDGTADFDPGAQVANLTSVDGSDGAVVKLNADGSFGWVRQVSGPGITWISGVVMDTVGNAYVAGFYEYSASLPTGHNLANPGTGAGTYQPGNSQFLMKLALGDPPTKFYVVDDASANRSYEYVAAGSTGGNNALNSGNSAPRGAASTAVGDKAWVVDANRTVYVYDINSNLLGSWTAGSMSSTATPEGIATNGTDVWIVDGKSDKVFKYTGAASRLSGSQNAASSFNLNSGNSNPKDIVTDGASLWVVNDSTTDKVFKYTAAGSLVGSWTIGSANSKPTGLTIDPSNVSDIWIVDSGTDLVYQYTGAASRTSGSQTAAATFALAAGNGNPQGIADPPPQGAQRLDVSRASGLSTAHVAAVSAAMGPEVSFLARTGDKTPSKKSDRLLVRQQAFESLAADRDFVRTSRAARRDSNGGEPACGILEPEAVGGIYEALDVAFESAFANVN